MEIIIKYEFLCVPDDAQFDTEKLKRKIKSEVRGSIRISDTDDVSYWSDEDEPEVLISKATTLITTDLDNGGTCQTDMSHIDQYRGIMFMYDSRYRQLSQPCIFKDKNGKFFRDGDVLQFTEHSGYIMQTGKMLICWNDEYGCYGYKFEHNPIKDVIIPFSEHGELKHDVFNHCELIGNISEHPELSSLFQ